MASSYLQVVICRSNRPTCIYFFILSFSCSVDTIETSDNTVPYTSRALRILLHGCCLRVFEVVMVGLTAALNTCTPYLTRGSPLHTCRFHSAVRMSFRSALRSPERHASPELLQCIILMQLLSVGLILFRKPSPIHNSVDLHHPASL